ncbi:retinoid-inducible serine carboxypeptidase-like [Styela clava]|uniref:retinoid-inducible serine carboxypeptidase-like n=1 Tax=Styela clava TaxID=7725 RepID=UPI00193928AB|nr:retinoid-inducible serine carboxypeptidase-like [Styela clava]
MKTGVQSVILSLLMISGVKFCRSQDPMDDIETACGYVEIRPNAFMFWLLYYQDESFAPDYLTPLNEVPVVVWLQGGPGASSTGYGNFEELGPLYLNLTRRPTSWTGLGHVLFIDNPVGSGYSYVREGGTYATNIDEVGVDLVSLLRGFYAETGLQDNPLYIFCESYGGKMAAVFGREIVKAINAGTLESNFKGVGLGDAWISPIDSVITWAPYLYQASLLDKHGFEQVQSFADATQQAVNNGNWERATNLWYATEIAILVAADNVNFYNILYPHHAVSTVKSLKNSTYFGLKGNVGHLFDHHVAPFAEYSLDDLMNGYFKDYLGIIPEDVIWGGQSGFVWDAMTGDFMKPTIDIVDANIADGIKVVVYNGMLDLIVDTPGQELWLAKLQWDKTEEFNNSKWKPRYYTAGVDTGGFSKEIDNFSFWWVLDAGHMVPTDQGEFMLYLLHDTITK